MSKVWAYLRICVEFVEWSVRSAVSGSGPAARKVYEWTRPRARSLARKAADHGGRALLAAMITLALVAAVVIGSLERQLPKAIERLAVFGKSATLFTRAALRASAGFAEQHRPRAPAVHTRASRAWWHGVEALAGSSVALQRLRSRLSIAVGTRYAAYFGEPSNADGDSETVPLSNVAAGEQQLAAIASTSSQSVMSSGASPSEPSSARISSR